MVILRITSRHPMQKTKYPNARGMFHLPEVNRRSSILWRYTSHAPVWQGGRVGVLGRSVPPAQNNLKLVTACPKQPKILTFPHQPVCLWPLQPNHGKMWHNHKLYTNKSKSWVQLEVTCMGSAYLLFVHFSSRTSAQDCDYSYNSRCIHDPICTARTALDA